MFILHSTVVFIFHFGYLLFVKLIQDSEWLRAFEENLEKSRNLNREITTLLESFQNRLVQLDQSVVPLQEKTALLQRKQASKVFTS